MAAEKKKYIIFFDFREFSVTVEADSPDQALTKVLLEEGPTTVAELFDDGYANAFIRTANEEEIRDYEAEKKKTYKDVPGDDDGEY